MIVGELDPSALVHNLGGRWLTAEGYMKRHASCSYTHAAIDLVQSLNAERAWNPEEITGVRVATHSLAKPLLDRHPHNRLAAMFSLPFVISNAVVNGRVDPHTMQPGTEAFEAAEAFSDRVTVEIDDALDTYLPDLRCTEVTVEFADGSHLGLAQPNPIGDAHHLPLSAADIDDKLVALIGTEATEQINRTVTLLTDARSATEVLGRLP